MESCIWRSGGHRFVDCHPGQAAIVGKLDIAAIVDREGKRYTSEYITSAGQSSLQMSIIVNPEHQLADYLSHVNCYTDRSPIV